LLGEAVAVVVTEQVDEEEKETELRETAVVRGMRSERLFFEPPSPCRRQRHDSI
jgi:predicted O-linked N-acetylglucosamine transferase (SPINDLY family)